jgi:hypothetical protein
VNGHGAKFGRKADVAVACLLAEPTIEAAAQRAGVSEVTLRRWLREPGFRALYQAARAGVLERVVGTLLAACTEAVETLRRNLSCGKPSVETRAAEVILVQATKGIETLDLAQRIAELELRAEAKR